MKQSYPANRTADASLHRNVSRLCILLLTGVLAAAMLSGCINRDEANILAYEDLRQAKSFYVLQHGKDTRNLNVMIRDRLASMGFEAVTGAEAKPPKQVDAIVTYIDRWRWDITLYLLELTINMTDGRSGVPLANGYSLHTSLTRKSPEEMVEEVLNNIFAKSKQAVLYRPRSHRTSM